MLLKVKCIGLKRGVSKKNGNKPFTNLFFDTTEICESVNSDCAGNVISTLFVWNKIPDSIIGTDILCSVDDYGNVKDCEI